MLRVFQSCPSIPIMHALYRAVITGKNAIYKEISDLEGTTLGISRPGRWEFSTIFSVKVLISRDAVVARRWHTS